MLFKIIFRQFQPWYDIVKETESVLLNISKLLSTAIAVHRARAFSE